MRPRMRLGVEVCRGLLSSLVELSSNVELGLKTG